MFCSPLGLCGSSDGNENGLGRQDRKSGWRPDFPLSIPRYSLDRTLQRELLLLRVDFTPVDPVCSRPSRFRGSLLEDSSNLPLYRKLESYRRPSTTVKKRLTLSYENFIYP